MIFPLLVLLSCGWVRGYLQGGDVTCDAASEGRIIQVPRITDITPCISCKCSRGVVKCFDRSKTCPSIRGCYNIVPTRDKCCPYKCKDCNAQRKSHGALWISPTDGTLSQCYAGILTYSTLPWIKEEHNNPQKNCKTDRNQILEPYQTLPDPADPCATCICLPSGRMRCFPRPCPVLDCPRRLIVRKPSNCCPVCSRNRDLRSGNTPNTTCLFQGRSYPLASLSGTSLVDASCPQATKCSCDESGGVPRCEREACSGPATCPAGTLRRPGPCCPECTPTGDPLGHVLKGYKGSACGGRGDGETWKNGECVTCTCTNGEVKCKTETCDAVCPPGHERVRKDSGECCEWECLPQVGVCTVFGDPHYRTFDGRIFNFQGTCKYLLSQECDPFTGSPLKNSSFSIRVTNDNRGTSAFSWTRTVTVRTPELRVSLLQRMRVKINGKKVSLPYIKLGTLSIMQDGYRILLRTHDGVRLLWDGISFLEVALPPKFRNRVCGLCGNFNGDNRDDLFGAKASASPRFGESWRVGGLKSCSSSPLDHRSRSVEPSCSQNWESKIKSDRNCNAFRSDLFRGCRSVVPHDYYFNACKLDMCECPGESCHCEVLTAYVRECERSGLRIPGWREATDCANVSSFAYSGVAAHKRMLLNDMPLRRDPKVTGRRKSGRKKLRKNHGKKRKRKKKAGALVKEDFKRARKPSSRKSRKELRRKRRRKKKKRKRKNSQWPHFEALLMGGGGEEAP